MYNTHFYPLRSIAGEPVEIESVFVLPNKHDHLSFINKLKAQQSDTVNDELYSFFLPEITKDGIVYQPSQGMDTLPLPFPNMVPFTSLAPVASFFAVPKDPKAKPPGYPGGGGGGLNPGLVNHINFSKEYSVTLIIKLKKEALIGGICFAGFPYTSQLLRHKPPGSTLSNNTIPREIRLTPLPRAGGGGSGTFRSHSYIDSEFAFTRQEIVSHSGYNWLMADPAKTNMFALTLSDFPEIVTALDFDGAAGLYETSSPETESFFGYALPYFYFFTYQEKTKTHPALHTGVLGIKTMIPPSDEVEDELTRVYPEYEFFKDDNENGVYATFSPHSMFGQKREYPISSLSKRKKFRECFISDLLQPEEKLIIYLQQGEEFDRCMAGLKILFAMLPAEERTEKMTDRLISWVTGSTSDGNLSDDERSFAEDVIAFLLEVPVETNFCEKIGLRVFEIDAPEGVSPAAINADSKYASVLVDTIIDTALEVLFSRYFEGIKFRRSSSARYFAMELTNKGTNPGQICIYNMQTVRSAHVSVQPRAARVQKVKSLHYRMIGPSLGEDFSRLGNEGFNFCIDRVVAGQTKNVLYSAMSLLDLMHTGGARIHSNVRRRATEFEMVENFREPKAGLPDYQVKKFAHDNFSGPNFEDRETDNVNNSWREIESGKDTAWPLAKGIPDFDEFENYSGTETRTRTEQISSILDPSFTAIEQLRDKLQTLIGGVPGGALIDYITASDKIFRNHNSANNFSGIWKPFSKFNFGTLPSIGGYQTLNIPPFFLMQLDMYNTLLSSLVTNVGTIDATTPLTVGSNAFDGMMSLLAMVNGVSLGINGGVGGSLSEVAAVALIAATGIPIVPSLSAGTSLSINSNLTTALRSSTNGSVGSISQTGQDIKYSLNRSRQDGYDNNVSYSEGYESEQKRIVTRRELLNKDTERVSGAEVMWQDKIQDIITGSIPLNFTLPATASQAYLRTADDSLRVRFNSGFSPSVKIDFWFELTEETIQDDY